MGAECYSVRGNHFLVLTSLGDVVVHGALAQIYELFDAPVSTLLWE